MTSLSLALLAYGALYVHNLSRGASVWLLSLLVCLLAYEVLGTPWAS